MRYLMIAVAMTVFVTTGFVGPATAHDITYDSKVTLDDYGPGVITNFFTGKVKSSKNACKPDRKVKVFRVAPGADTLIGSTTSASDGDWSLGNDVAGPGNYYAKLRLRDIGASLHDHVCKRAKSDKLTVA